VIFINKYINRFRLHSLNQKGKPTLVVGFFFLLVEFETTIYGGGRGLGVRLLAVREKRSTTREKISSVGQML
jgi:hypothetical protein